MTLSEAFVNAARDEAREYGYELATVTVNMTDTIVDVPAYREPIAYLTFANGKGQRHIIPVHNDADDIGLARALVEVGLGEGN